jgi:hypothetical protein
VVVFGTGLINPQQTDDRLFGSGHLQPAVDTFPDNRPTEVFRCPLLLGSYTFYWIGKSLAMRDSGPWHWPAHCDTAVPAGGPNLR